jgi:hypothetical protein
MLSSIEIYNKPNFSYREETFAILAINAIELLFKAQLLKLNSYKMESLYIMEPVKTKNGSDHKRKKKPRKNRTGNPSTISIYDCIKNLENLGCKLTSNHFASIEALIELRDNAIHFHNENIIAKEIQELGFAWIKNYMHIIKEWQVDIDLSAYNFYLMPLAYIDSKIQAEGIITDEIKNYLNFVRQKVDTSDKKDEIFDIAISIDINFKKSNRFEGLGFKYDPNGIEVKITEEDMKQKYPLSYDLVVSHAQKRYSDFKKNKKFNEIMALIKKNSNLYHQRKLDPDSPKSMTKPYYSTNIWQELDKKYNK